jgi:hypothetical protein
MSSADQYTAEQIAAIYSDHIFCALDIARLEQKDGPLRRVNVWTRKWR